MIIKCKMCGGDLEITEGSSVAECEYCGSRQTIPSADSEKKMTLFARAGRLLRGCEFDKAAGVFESIVADFPEEAEAYWGLVLCKYGIEYVDDPATGKKIPTCHRSSFESVMDDKDFDLAAENADAVARKVYRDEAKQIEELRRGIVAVSANEEPYDIFICYKETDENGERTLDSVLAQDIYDALMGKGYRTFFARITLEDKLGLEYEPYIFAALNSAKVMLAVGTDYEYYNAVWVKNEWSRFLKLMTQDKSKHLIPCYKGIDAYDMPQEFARLQAQDLGKVGAVQDLLRGVEKLVSVKKAPVAETGVGSTAAQLLKRARTLVEGEDWDKADICCEQLLNLEPENAEAYLLKLMVERRVTQPEALADSTRLLEGSENYKQALKYGGIALTNKLQDWNEAIRQRLEAEERKRKKQQKKLLKGMLALAAAAALCVAGVFVYKSIIAPSLAYKAAEELLAAGDYAGALNGFRVLDDFRDAEARCIEVRTTGRRAGEQRMAAGDYEGAVTLYEEMGWLAESPPLYYAWGEALLAQGDYAEAVKTFEHAGSYEDAPERIKAAYYAWGEALMGSGDYAGAEDAFRQAKDYSDAPDRMTEAHTATTEEEVNLLRNEISSKQVGETFKFGNYSGSTTYAAAQPATTVWRVLAKEKDRVLVISENILDYCERSSQDYEFESKLHSIYTGAFTLREKRIIEGGKLFLLSVEEAKMYFADDEDRKAESSKETFSGPQWWLEGEAEWGNLSGRRVKYFPIVEENGSISKLHSVSAGIRPAMWLDLSED